MYNERHRRLDAVRPRGVVPEPGSTGLFRVKNRLDDGDGAELQLLIISGPLNYEVEKVLLRVREETGELRRGDADRRER